MLPEQRMAKAIQMGNEMVAELDRRLTKAAVEIARFLQKEDEHTINGIKEAMKIGALEALSLQMEMTVKAQGLNDMMPTTGQC